MLHSIHMYDRTAIMLLFNNTHSYLLLDTIQQWCFPRTYCSCNGCHVYRPFLQRVLENIMRAERKTLCVQNVTSRYVLTLDNLFYSSKTHLRAVHSSTQHTAVRPFFSLLRSHRFHHVISFPEPKHVPPNSLHS